MSFDGRSCMADAFPALTLDMVDLLRIDGSCEAIAAQLGDLPVFGWCTCAPRCSNLLTAPFGSSGPYVISLELYEDPVAWLSLDPKCESVTAIEILDSSVLGEAAHQELHAQ